MADPIPPDSPDDGADGDGAGGDGDAPVTPPVNVRLHLPLFGRRYYLSIVAGRERREPERRASERRRHPLPTIANILFFIAVGALFYVAALAGIVLQSAIVEF